MKQLATTLTLAGTLVFAGLSHAQANISVRRGTVVPIIVEDNLKLRETRVGDRFVARIDEGRVLPWGTKFVGKVLSVRDPHRDRPGSMELEFFELRLPDGTTQPVRSVIVSLEKNGRARDGRVLAEVDTSRTEANVIGGAAAGAVLGSIIRKPVEGAIIGLLGGIAASETNRNTNSDWILRKGQKFGALIEQDLNFRFGGEFRRYRAEDVARREDEERRRQEEVRSRQTPPNQNSDDWRMKDRMEEHNAGSVVRDRDRDRDQACEVRFKGKSLRYTGDVQPFYEEDCLMVPLEQTAKPLQFSTEISERTSMIYLDSDEVTVRFNRQTGEYRWNGRTGKVSRPAIERRGVIYVPADLFREICGNDFQIVRNGSR